MPQTQLSSKLGSDNSIFGLKETKNVSRSKFDFSKKNFTTIDLGAITPVDWFQVFPGDTVRLNARYILDTFPLEVPPFNNYFVRTHWYYIKNSALWKGWNTFITRGRSGNIDLEIPSLTYSAAVSSYVFNGKYRNYSCPNGLMDYLGIKPKYYNNDPSKSSYLPFLENNSDSFTATGYKWVQKFSILPMFAYQKICRFNYIPTNLLQDNKVWLPDDLEDPWYIDYSASNLSGPYFVPESATMPDDEFICREVPSADADTGDNAVDCRQLRYALFGDDYFTSAKPWLVRGTETELDLGGGSLGKVGVNWLDTSIDSAISMMTGLTGDPSDNQFVNFVNFAFPNTADWRFSNIATAVVGSHLDPDSDSWNASDNWANPVGGSYYSPSDTSGVWSKDNLETRHKLGVDLSQTKMSAVLSANTLRNLLALSVWQERNTLTGGNYSQSIKVHWNRNPKAPEYQPLYIGGTSDLVNFGQVIQNSHSVSGSPLGTKAGQGSAVGGADVFDFTADDYGIIMGVMIISPEVIYTQGAGHEWTDLTFDDQFQPEFANLGYQAILNQEIFPQGNSYDDDLFGYQTRYAYLKQRNNTVSGMFDLDSTQDSVFGPYVQARRFDSLPALSMQFVTMSPDNLDRSFLSFSNLPAFKLQFASDVQIVRALPYQSTPETFGF